MRLRAKNIVFLLLMVLPLCFKAQKQKFDSLTIKATKLKHDNFPMAKLYCDSAMALALSINDNMMIAEAFVITCNVYVDRARYKEAMGFLDKAEEYIHKTDITKNDNKLVLSSIYTNRGICYERMGNYDKCVEMHLKSLAMRQELKNERQVSASYQNLGAVYFYMGKYDKCEENTLKAIEITEKRKDRKLLGELYDNLGACYFSMYLDTLAEEFMLKSLAIAYETRNSVGIENSYNNLASLYVEIGKPLLAKSYLYKAMKTLSESPERVTSILQNMAKVYEKTNKADSALFYYKEALVRAQNSGNSYRSKNIYFDLSKFYFARKDFENAYKTQAEYHKLDDSLTNVTNMRNVAELETVYKTEKQGKEIELLNAENKIQRESSENRKKLLWVSLGALVLALIAAVAFYRNFVRKKKDNLLLQDKNAQIQRQKDLIAEKNKEIVDSITYAKRLQEAILPPVEQIQKHLPKSFVLYKPKDIVAGDFYWMHISSDPDNYREVVGSSEKRKESILIAVADCTGHGVPGAMVSVVCANALNAAVKEFGLTEPAKILDKVNELVEETFGKSSSEVKDGMDISLVRIEELNDHPDNKLPKGKLVIPKGQSLAEVIEANKKFDLHWAGANNPLWYIKDGEWSEIKANKQPVGKFDNRKPFTDHHVQLKAGDSLFLISDGFADQFGGKEGKKMKNKAMKELLFKNSKQSPEYQKQNLENAFDTWSEGYEQVDDVCVIGIRL